MGATYVLSILAVLLPAFFLPVIPVFANLQFKAVEPR